ncbi:hypothetical protein L195_g035720 [Trifolium pratense]|uniref:Uncharacterized protein n=1 Tax=Trifolium pratense TaxID=57577 RepID=A0A2K3LMH6_TRIPR|nr:hypothetical protein L195_g035720 [Trifolium pratense]
MDDMAELIVSPEDFPSSSSAKGKAVMDPFVVEKFKALEDAIDSKVPEEVHSVGSSYWGSYVDRNSA